MSIETQPRPSVMPAEIAAPNEAMVGPEQSIRAHTFGEAERLTKALGEPTIGNILTGDLTDAVGKRVVDSTKLWLDSSAPTELDREISKRPDVMSELHNDTADLIKNNLKVAVDGLGEKEKDYIQEAKQGYLDKLDRGKTVFNDVAHGKKDSSGKRIKLNGVHEFTGFDIPTPEGVRDLSDFETTDPRVRPNIRVQREPAGTFVHWDTDKRTQEKVRGEESEELAARIYLNPRTPDQTATFETLMKAMNEAGISAKGKMLVRENESLSKNGGDEIEAIRADAILLVVGEEHADDVLELALALYKDNPDVFEGRPTPKVPVKVAPGISVGVETGDPDASLTSSRAELIDAAASKVRAEQGLRPDQFVDPANLPDAVQSFNRHLQDEARIRGINPDNLAFAA